MKTVDAVDSEIRFTAHWGGVNRYVFIPDPYVSNDAGWTVSRAEAIAYVRQHLERYTAEARAQHGDENPVKIVILSRRKGVAPAMVDVEVFYPDLEGPEFGA